MISEGAAIVMVFGRSCILCKYKVSLIQYPIRLPLRMSPDMMATSNIDEYTPP
jgi:hypothetical protein